MTITTPDFAEILSKICGGLSSSVPNYISWSGSGTGGFLIDGISITDEVVTVTATSGDLGETPSTLSLYNTPSAANFISDSATGLSSWGNGAVIKYELTFINGSS